MTANKNTKSAEPQLERMRALAIGILCRFSCFPYQCSNNHICPVDILNVYYCIAELSGIRVTEKCLFFRVRRISAQVPQSGIRAGGVSSRLSD
jgi:hypothetical protein